MRFLLRNLISTKAELENSVGVLWKRVNYCLTTQTKASTKSDNQ